MKIKNKFTGASYESESLRRSKNLFGRTLFVDFVPGKYSVEFEYDAGFREVKPIQTKQHE